MSDSLITFRHDLAGGTPSWHARSAPPASGRLEDGENPCSVGAWKYVRGMTPQPATGLVHLLMCSTCNTCGIIRAEDFAVHPELFLQRHEGHAWAMARDQAARDWLR